ncbi:MAG: thiamine pyrophosphate-binding protein [Gammaproteobacteria bacterium]|nr:thiamine pyrophosphate-binding protein [Gammaproteobacteria bacterium]
MSMDSTAAASGRVADALVTRLAAHGVERVFAVAGESYLDVLDALYDRRDAIDVVTCRHEAAAANMAEATAKLSDRCGVAFVTRGPGLAHASIGVHTAQQDATPMVLFVGEIAREDRFRHAFQEVDLSITFADLAKGVLQIDLPQRTAEIVDRAFQLARANRPGPVIVGLPEDVLGEAGASATGEPPAPVELPAPSVERIREIAARVGAARRPLVWVGGSGWTADGIAATRRFAEAWELPVVTAFRRKDHFPNASSSYAGELGFGTPPGLVERVRAADLLLVLGAPLGDIETGGYRWLDRTRSAGRLIHLHRDAATLSAVFPAGLALQCDVNATAEALAALEPPARMPRSWSDWTRAARAEHVAFIEPVEVVGDLNLSRVFRQLRADLPESAIVTNGAGNYAAWLHRFFGHDTHGTQLAPGSGAMGYAVPAAIAAKLAHPGREVVCVAGDGCFLMSAQELATAAARGLKILFLIINNGSYGTIRMHQENRFPGRTVATALHNPDFVAYARAFGLRALRVARTEEFAAALTEARAAPGPALIELVTSVVDIAPGKRLPASDR